MRKNFLLGLGLVLVVASVIGFVDASRYQYHVLQRAGFATPNYQDHRHASVHRPHSLSYVNPYANTFRNQNSNRYRAQCDLRDQYGCHYFNKQMAHTTAKDRLDYKLQRPQLNPRVENTFQNNRLVVRNGDYIDRAVYYRGEPRVEDLVVVESTYYTLDTMSFAQDSGSNYRNNTSSLAFRVLQSPSDYKCSQSNFWSCVGRLTNNFKETQSITSVTNASQDFRWNDTQALSFARFPTVTESFESNGRTYYIMSALNPVDGSIVRIEGVVAARDTNSAAQAMHKVFESFRFRQ